jgi:hypothetical protein
VKTLQPRPQLEPGADFPSLPSALSAGDLRGVSGCLAKDACLLTPDGTAVHGRETVRQVLAQLVAVAVLVLWGRGAGFAC